MKRIQHDLRLKVIQELITADPDIKPKEILQYLKDNNHVISRQQLSRDLKQVKEPDTWLADLAKKNYGEFVRDRVNRCLKCANVIESIMDRSKDDKVKLIAAKALHSCEVSLAGLVSSDILKVSAANWAAYTRQLENEIHNLKALQANKVHE